MSNITSNTISVIGGAALGALAAYLLDPDHGYDRRRQVVSTANDAASNANDTLRSTVADTADSAKGLAASISQYAHQLADHVSKQAAAASDQARNTTDQAHNEFNSSIDSLIGRAKDYAADLKSRVQMRANDFSDRAKSSVSRQTGWQPAPSAASAAGNAAGVSTGVLGALALGAGVMFFLDPARGRSRRVWALDKVNSWINRGSKSAKRYSRHVGNQLKGVAAQAKSAIPDGLSDSVKQTTNQVKDALASQTNSLIENTD